jgi:spore coat polysaccharide biosynthesis predicted glycosyltransferase SpsG
MNRSPVFLRVDGTGQSGYERLARCMTIAAALQRRRRPVYFLADLEPASLAMTLKRGGNDWIAMHNPVGAPADLAQVQKEMNRLHPAAILVDSPLATKSYLQELVAAGPMVISVDHQAAIRLPSHIVVNPLLGPSRDSYEYGPAAQLLMGSRYALVRPEIRRHRPTRSQEPAPLPVAEGKGVSFRALVALGEDDPQMKTLELAKLLLGAPKIGRVDVIVRKEHPRLEAIQAAAAANPDRLEVALEPAEVTARLVRCHFAITGGSGWSNELACIGVPQLVLVQNEIHWPNAQKLEDEGCASVVGWHENTSASTIRNAVQNLLADPLERQSMARCGRKRFDGRGPDRLVNAIEIVLAGKARREILAVAA